MLLERVTELQERMLDGLAENQRRVIDANEKLAERVKGRVPAVPFADRLPKPEEWIAVSYGFWGRWLNANRSFAEDLARVWTPEDAAAAKPAATPAPVAPAVPVPTTVAAGATTTRPRARKTATSMTKAPARTTGTKTAAKKAAPSKRAPAKRATKAAGTRATRAS